MGQPMNKKLLELILSKFDQELRDSIELTDRGRTAVLAAYKRCVNEAILEMLDAQDL
jgi:hypothetical protein